MKNYSPTYVKEVLNKYSFAPLKRFGQNFLIDDNILNKIVNSLPQTPENIIEIGGGLGALSLRLCESGFKLLTFEIDDGLYKILAETLSETKSTVINADAMKVDFSEYADKYFNERRVSICANLPYYITTPLIMNFFESSLEINTMVLMMQKEVAKRICASANTSEYGALSVVCSFFSSPQILFEVKNTCFYPKPDVDSCVVELKIKDYDNELKKHFLYMVKILFAKRRKTLLNNLLCANIPKDAAKELLRGCEIKENFRAEQLNTEDFMKLTAFYKKYHSCFLAAAPNIIK